MKNFSRGYNKGGRQGGFGDRRGPAQLHDAQCAGCGDRCQVPFRPNGRKPVFCTNCFKKDDAGAQRPQRFERPSFGQREQRVEGAFGAPQQPMQQGPNLAALEARLARMEQKIDALIEAMVSDEEL